MHTDPVQIVTRDAPPPAREDAAPRSDAFAGMIRESGRDDRPDRKPQDGAEDGGSRSVRAGEARRPLRDESVPPTREAAGPTAAAEDDAVPDPTTGTPAAPEGTAAEAGPTQAVRRPTQMPSFGTAFSGSADEAVDGDSTPAGSATAIPPAGDAAATQQDADARPGGDMPGIHEQVVATISGADAVEPAAATDSGQHDAPQAIPATPAEPAPTTAPTTAATTAPTTAPAVQPARPAPPGAATPADATASMEAVEPDGDTAADSGMEFDGDGDGGNETASDSDGEPVAGSQRRTADETGPRPGGAEPARRNAATAPADSAAKPPAPVEQAASPTSAAQPQPGGHAAPAASFGNELRTALAAATDTAQSAPPRGAPMPAAEQLAVRIHRAVHEGADRLTLQLKPFELGRVSVQVEFTHDHRVVAVISAERADTMDLLQRDARALERALQDAGLKTDSNSLSFEAHGDGRGHRFGDEEGSGRPFAMPVASEEIGPESMPVQAWQPGDARIDIRI